HARSRSARSPSRRRATRRRRRRTKLWGYPATWVRRGEPREAQRRKGSRSPREGRKAIEQRRLDRLLSLFGRDSATLLSKSTHFDPAPDRLAGTTRPDAPPLRWRSTLRTLPRT